jgi:signal transduction histidine kinase
MLWVALITFGVARAEIQELVPVALSVQVQGQSSRDLEPRLPFHWDSNLRGQEGSATLITEFLLSPASQPLAVLFPRIGNGFSVELNGEVLLKRGMDRNPRQDFGKQPHWVALPGALLMESNRLVIRIEAQRGRKAGISKVLLGSEEEVRSVYESQRQWRVYGVLMVATASATLGVFGLMVWARRREGVYLTYSLSELLWAFAMLDPLTESTLLPWPHWGLATSSAQALAGMLICKFLLMVSGVNSVWPARATTLVLAATVPLLVIALWGGLPALDLLLLLISQAVGIWVIVAVIRQCIRSDDLELKVLALALCGLLLVVVRDLYVLVLKPYSGLFGSWGSHYGEYPWMRYGWLIFGLVLAWVLANRMWRDARGIAEVNAELSSQLHAQQHALEASFRRDLQVRAQQAQAEERQRLSRDMHDGLGAHLTGALHIARQENATPTVLIPLLEEALDQLKLGIDVMHAPDATLESLLGSLRYRLEPRLRAAGVRLHWSVDEFAELQDWSVDRARHVQMIFFEAFSNIVQHSGATEARFTAACLPAQGLCRLSLWDNGRAHGKRDRQEPPAGHGLRNMRWRADHLQAPLKIDFGSDGTRVELELKLKAHCSSTN